jgi:hypothetical protein
MTEQQEWGQRGRARKWRGENRLVLQRAWGDAGGVRVWHAPVPFPDTAERSIPRNSWRGSLVWTRRGW